MTKSTTWGVSLQRYVGNVPSQNPANPGGTVASSGFKFHVGKVDAPLPTQKADQSLGRALTATLDALKLPSMVVGEQTFFKLPAPGLGTAPATVGVGLGGQFYLYDSPPEHQKPAASWPLSEASGLRFISRGKPLTQDFAGGKTSPQGLFERERRDLQVGCVRGDDGAILFYDFSGDTAGGLLGGRLDHAEDTPRTFDWQADLMQQGFAPIHTSDTTLAAWSYQGAERAMRGVIVTGKNGALHDVLIPRVQPYQGKLCTAASSTTAPSAQGNHALGGYRFDFADGSTLHLQPPSLKWRGDTWQGHYSHTSHYHLTLADFTGMWRRLWPQKEAGLKSSNVPGLTGVTER